mgnify:CR=1 FL=1|tara:strand:+ start:5912 stop:6121 length:210 start_codon:yes stop_codon:yes gene_type:complete
MKNELPRVEWMFLFKNGGWNSVYAKTKKTAIKIALKEYQNSSSLEPDINSFKRVDKNPESYKILMSLFN